MMDNSYEEITVVIDSNNAEASLKELIESFQGLNSLVSNIRAAITKAFASMQNSLIKTESSIGALTKVLTDMTAKLQELSQTSFLDVFATIIDTTTLIADLAINAELLGKVFSKLGGVLANFGGWIAGAFSTIGSWITGTLIPLISGAITACGGWIVAIVAAVIAAIVAVVVYWDEIKLFFTETLPQLWNQFVEWISGIGAAAAGLFSGAMSAISGFFTDCWNGIVEIWSGIGEWMQSNVIQPILAFFAPIVQWFAELFGSIWQTVSDVFYNIGVIITGCWEIIQTAWSLAAQWFDTNIIQPVAGFFVGLWTSVSTWAIDAWNAIAEVFIGIGSWIDNNIIQPVAGFFSGLWDGFLSAAKDAWEGVKSVFSTVAEFFGNIFSDAWEGVVKVFSAAGEIFTDIKEGILTAFTSIVNGLITGINSAIAIPFKGINTAIDAIRSIKIFDITPFTGLKTINVPQIPYLAKGAVLPANRPFLAMVGDQRHGTNVEAPLSTIQEAVAVVLNGQLSALMAGFEAVVAEQRATREMIAQIQIGDDMIANAVHRYDRKMAVMRGG